ncbi:hypothetical protein BJ944DRAFT_270972 [Cunninghamella echinulata]|nr:hypothetical protein BJ944DRAFT_270972 [Cunninghamella echinulata]
MRIPIILLLCTSLFIIQANASFFSKSSSILTTTTTSSNENIINITIKQAIPYYNKLTNSIQYMIPATRPTLSSSQLLSSNNNNNNNMTPLFMKRQEQEGQGRDTNGLLQINKGSSTSEGIHHNGHIAAFAMVLLFCILTF